MKNFNTKMKSADVFNNEKSLEPCIDWNGHLKMVTLFSITDLSIQSQFLSGWTINPTEEYIPKEEFSEIFTGNQTCPITSNSSPIGNHLFYSAVFRLLFMACFFHISNEKSIPKKIQPFIGYILSAIVYLMCVHTVTTFLINSEYSDTFAVVYIITWLLNLCSIAISGILVYNILYISGAITQNEKEREEKEEDGGKKDYFDLWNEKRKVPFFIMLRKIIVWYKPQSYWIVLSYIVLAFKMSSKFLFKFLHV